MITALNYLLPVVVIALLYLAFRLKKFWPLVVAVVFVVVYGAVQPSYIPKGTVKTYTPPPFETVDKPIVDRSLKPKSAEQYDAERNAAIEQINTSINNAIEKQKQE